MKPALPRVTLVCVDSRDPTLAAQAIERCRSQIDFGACVFFTDRRKLDRAALARDVEIVDVRLESIEAYSGFMLHDLAPHVRTSHALVVQWDGFVVDAGRWDDAFLDYDYIGAPWPGNPAGRDVGNGGFSLRSKRLLDALARGSFAAGHPEDVCIGVDHRARLES
jgi:hypothetical protein